MSIILKELGYTPYIIGTHLLNFDISFINQTTNLVIIKNNFSEIKKTDYDVLIVNSDQTWRRFDKHFYDYGFLKFAENWKIKKIVYGASLGFDKWNLTSEDEKIAKKLVKKFSAVSVREKGSIKLIKQHFGIIPEIVLDPTLLIKSKYYFDIIKDYKHDIFINKKYIFIYSVHKSKNLEDTLEKARLMFKFEIYYYNLKIINTIQDFIYYIANCNAVLTNSFHGTIFSIIFNKPFLTIYDSSNAKERFNWVRDLFGVNDRLVENEQKPDIYQLLKPLNINKNLLNKFKLQSINFLKKNLKN